MNGWTTATQVAAAAALLAVLVALALVVVLLRLRASSRRQAAEAREVRDELVRRLEALERPEPQPRSSVEVAEFVITDVGREPETTPEAPVRMEGRLFADVVLRETVVKAASWTHGLRTALAAENRNRIRFEVKRESRRSTKQRKADVKEALRQYYARQDAPSQEDLA